MDNVKNSPVSDAFAYFENLPKYENNPAALQRRTNIANLGGWT
ncbi:hypothetical protein FACS189499_10430 [Clostridia bacterium]|nr:hypothetical protein FACS189499_10430 [Clostridia bacterium]